MPLASRLKRMRVGDALRRNPLYYEGARRLLQSLDVADLAQRRAWTQNRLGEVLWAARRTGYGKRVRGSEQQLESWPLLDKRQVQADPRAFCAGASWLAVRAHTGGTSGAPLRLLRSVRSIAFEQACLDFLTQRVAGEDGAQARCAVLRTETIKDPNDFSPPYWIYASAGARMVCSSTHLNAATIGTYAEALRAFAPAVLYGYPTSLEALCRLLRARGERLHVPAVVCSSEVLHAPVWTWAREQLGCALLDYYGQAERVGLAFATREGEYRFLPGYAHVELEPVGREHDRRVYEIVGTGLWNLAMPLVRYRTGDLIHLPEQWGPAELEEVALGLRSFRGVRGRDSDILLTPDGVRITGLSHFYRDVSHVERVQIIQETSRSVQILVLAGDGYGRSDEERLLHNVRAKVPASVRVSIRRVEALERTALGKTPFVIHRPAVKQLLQAGPVCAGTA